jgi:RNA 3'-terminal phosphate cyclase (ATP)
VIEIDGAIGEGGGQVLRSALTLSLLTGQAFGMTRVRASRPRPGLFPQHLAAVQAAAQISAADVAGDRIGSRELHFAPGPVQAGRYHFDIGTAGATSLVLQTLLLPLALAEARSSLSISGGTHVPWSPCFHYLDWHWRPLLARLGIEFQLELAMAGFYPQGGGELRAEIPGGARPVSLNLPERGGLQRLRGLSAVANLPLEIAERQRSQALRRLGRRSPELDVHIEVQPLPARSPGTLLLLLAEPLHGGANQRVVEMLVEIGRPENVRSWLDKRLAAKAKIWGMGHREYKVKDPRATILQKMMRELMEKRGGNMGPLFETALALEQACEEKLAPKGVYANVDFYSGILYREMGIPPDQFTSIFAVARSAGWLAHWREQLGDNRIFRPTQMYTGEKRRRYVPIDMR